MNERNGDLLIIVARQMSMAQAQVRGEVDQRQTALRADMVANMVVRTEKIPGRLSDGNKPPYFVR